MSKLQSFLANYEKEKTKKTFVWVLGVFSKSIYGDKKNLDEKMDQYLSEKRDYEKDVEEFYISLNGKPPLSKRLMVSNLKTFLLDNDIEISTKFWKRLKERNKVAVRAVSFDEIPETKQLQQIFTHLNAKAKALFMVLTSSGMRIGEALQLLLNDIDFTSTPTKIRIRAETTKTGSKRVAFISEEATEAIKEWLKVRSSAIDTIVKRSSTRKAELNKNRIFPFEHNNASYMWREALIKAKLDQRDVTTGRYNFHVHVLRKFFRTQMATVIQVDIVEALMGHEGYLTSVYRKYSTKQLSEFYLKAEHTVSIFKDTQKIMKLKKEIDITKSEIEQHNKSLGIQLDNVRAENIQQKDQISKLKCDTDCNRAYIQDLIEQVHELNEAYSQLSSYKENSEIIAEIETSKKILKIKKN